MGARGYRRAHPQRPNHKRWPAERGGNIRFGYYLAEDGRHPEPDNGEQAALSAIRVLRQSRHTLREIQTRLNEQGFRTRWGSPKRHDYFVRVMDSIQ